MAAAIEEDVQRSLTGRQHTAVRAGGEIRHHRGCRAHWPARQEHILQLYACVNGCDCVSVKSRASGEELMIRVLKEVGIEEGECFGLASTDGGFTVSCRGSYHTRNCS